MARRPSGTALALAVVAAVGALAALAALRGTGAPDRPPARVPEATSTSAPAVAADAPLAVLPDVPARYAQAVVIAIDGACRATLRSLGAPAFDRALDVDAIDACGAAWSRDGRYAASVDYPAAVPSVLLLDRGAATSRRLPVAGLDAWPRAEPLLAVTAAGRVAVCADGRRTQVVPRSRPLDGCAPAVGVDGRLLVATPAGDVADADGSVVVPAVALPDGFRILALTATADAVALAGGLRGDLVVLRVAAGVVTGRVDVGPDARAAAPTGSVRAAIALAPAGGSAFVRLAERAVAVSFASGAVVEQAGDAPLADVAYAPDGGAALLLTARAAFLADPATLRPSARIGWAAGTLRVLWPAPRGA